MKKAMTLAVAIMVGLAPGTAVTSAQAIRLELLAGALGSAVGWVGGFFLGRTLATAVGFESQPVQKDLVTVATLLVAVTGGTSLGVIGAGWSQGVDGNELACVGGTLLGMVVGMAVEPMLGRVVWALVPHGSGPSEAISTVIEVLGVASMVLVPAISATIGFNIGATDR